MDGSFEIFAEGLDFGEGPRWHEGRLWASDFYAHRIVSFGSDGHLREELAVDDQPSGLGWLPTGELLFVAMESRQVRRRDHDGTVRVHGDLTEIATGDCNDMVVGPTGIAYVGNFGFNPAAGEGPRSADLALVRTDGTVEVAASGIDFPNGSVITPDGTTLIVGESIGQRYTAFTIQDDGRLDGRRVWAELPGMAPDGCALDAAGGIWFADATGAGCARVLEGGEVTHRLTTEQPAFACALGGVDRRTLFVLTAPGFGEEASAGKGLGRVEAIEVDIPGAGWP